MVWNVLLMVVYSDISELPILAVRTSHTAKVAHYALGRARNHPPLGSLTFPLSFWATELPRSMSTAVSVTGQHLYLHLATSTPL